MVLWCHCWLSWMSMLSYPCWGMPPGPCQTSAGENLNQTLNWLVYWLNLFLLNLVASVWFVYWLRTCVFFPFNQTKPALPALERLIHSNDEEVLTDACWALSYLSDGTNDKIQAVIEAGVCPRLVELLLYVLSTLISFAWVLLLWFFFSAFPSIRYVSSV